MTSTANQPVLARAWSNQGRRVKFQGRSVEDVIIKYRKRRRGRCHLSYGEYSIDNGQSWLRI